MINTQLANHRPPSTDLALIYCHPVEAHGGKHHGALVPGLGQVMVDADPEQRLAVILPPVANTPELGPGNSGPALASLPLGAGLGTCLPESGNKSRHTGFFIAHFINKVWSRHKL